MKLSWKSLKDMFNMSDNKGITEGKEHKGGVNQKPSGSRPKPPEGEIVMEGEKPDYDDKNMRKGWNPAVGGYQPTANTKNLDGSEQTKGDPPPSPHSSINPTFKKFWSENGDRIAELVNVGGWNPVGYGDIREDEEEYLYGRIGLTENEFLEHIYLLSKISGMVDILGDDHLEWLQDQMEIEWERVEGKKDN